MSDKHLIYGLLLLIFPLQDFASERESFSLAEIGGCSRISYVVVISNGGKSTQYISEENDMRDLSKVLETLPAPIGNGPSLLGSGPDFIFLLKTSKGNIVELQVFGGLIVVTNEGALLEKGAKTFSESNLSNRLINWFRAVAE